MDCDPYEQRLQALREENELLREAARAFGELAERLACELRTLQASIDRNQYSYGRPRAGRPPRL